MSRAADPSCLHRAGGSVWGRVAAVVAACVAAIIAVVAASAGPVAAHAQLIEVTPANGELLAEPPTEVTLRFNEPVTLTGGEVRVLDDDAQLVSSPPQLTGSIITVPLASDLADGTYTIAYEVVSADSHRITGASIFHVGAPSSSALVVSESSDSGVAPLVRLGGVVFSAIGYGGALIATGVLVLTVLADRSRPFGRRPGPRVGVTNQWDAWIIRSAVLGAVGLIAATPFRIARLGGSLDALRDNELLRSALGGPVGQSLAITVGCLFVLAFLVEMWAPGWLTLLVAGGALAGFVVEGHTRAERPVASSILDLVHLGAAAVWLGGLVGVAVAFRSDVDPARLTALIRRFSNSAVVAVVVVATAGAVLAWIILPGVSELTSTGWGLALITKLALVAVVVGLGAYNNRKLVAPPAGGDASAVRSRLRRIVQVEIAILLAVVVVSAVLVTRSPVSSSAPVPLENGVTPVAEAVPGDSAPGTGDALMLTVELQAAGGTEAVAELLLDPVATGTNRIEVLLRDTEGRAINPVEPPTVQFTQPEVGVGPLAATMTPIYIGDYQGTVDLPFDGTWDITVRVRVSDFASISGTTTFAVE